MSDKDDPTHGATTIHASKGGGGGKWLLGGLAAVLLAGAGYYAWTNYGPNQTNAAPQTAYNDTYQTESTRAAPLPNDQATAPQSTTSENLASNDSASTPAPATSSTHRAAARAVPEETIGVTPATATAYDTSEEVVVNGTRPPLWTSTPSQRRLTSFYPVMALERGREGEAQLHCTVQSGGALDCVRVSETPGFGGAALRVANAYRHGPQFADGSDAIGSPLNLRVVFRIADSDRG